MARAAIAAQVFAACCRRCRRGWQTLLLEFRTLCSDDWALAMRPYHNDDLLRLLSDGESSFRMMALHFLSEGYADSPLILKRIFAGWEQWGIEAAFPEFPMLSYVSISPEDIAECCDRADKMAQERKLTDPVSRCAGKLLEQVVCLQAHELASYVDKISTTASQSKAFFRVDLSLLHNRIESLGRDADTLMQQLENAIESLCSSPEDSAAFHDALNALEVLRTAHPQTLSMAAVLQETPPDDGSRAVSFQLAMQSIRQFPEAGTESVLAKHLSDPRQAVHSSATEALVRLGTALAAAMLVSEYPDTEATQQRWIARGLQRIRANGLAEEIARLRAATEDPTLWLMLLVAEVRQLSGESLARLAAELDRVNVFSGALMDALTLYTRTYEAVDGARELQQSYMNYLQRINRQIQSKLGAELTNRIPGNA